MTLVVDASLKKLGAVIVGSVVVCKKFTRIKRLHDINAFAAIVVTELGIVMEVSFVQLWNALAAILVTEFGIVMEVRPEQPLNAYA